MRNSDLFNKGFSIYKMILSGLYFVGFILHFLDVMNLRLNFSDMDLIWKSWILFLLIFDFLTSVGLFLKKPWGESLFIVVAVAQLIAYIGFSSFFGEQISLIYFHVFTLFIYVVLKFFLARSQKLALLKKHF